VAVLNIKPSGQTSMGKSLMQWFIFSLVVSYFIAYLASRTVAPGTPYLQVFRVVGTIGFLAYAAAQIPAAIWMGKPWSVAWKEVFDGLLYGCMTAERLAGSGRVRNADSTQAPGTARRRSRSRPAGRERALRSEAEPVQAEEPGAGRPP
jgi:hypothetical protein